MYYKKCNSLKLKLLKCININKPTMSYEYHKQKYNNRNKAEEIEIYNGLGYNGKKTG